MKKYSISLTPAQCKTVWQALSERDEAADICTGAKGKLEPDSELRDTENVQLSEDIETYFEREVKPYVQDAWIDHEKTRIGYEIPFTRHFYKYASLRNLADINTELAAITANIVTMLNEIDA
jgi:type I restriction enzyme M protein